MTEWTPESLREQDPAAYDACEARFLEELRGLMAAAFSGPNIDVAALRQLSDQQVSELILQNLPAPLKHFNRSHIESLFAWFEQPTAELNLAMQEVPLGIELLQPPVQEYIRQYGLNPDGDVDYIRVRWLVFIQRLLELADEMKAEGQE